MIGANSVVAIAMLAAIGVLIESVLALAKAHSTSTWPPVRGEIIFSTTVMHRVGIGVWQYASVLYEYSVAGKQFTGSRVCFGDLLNAYRVALKYPEGAHVTVYANPLKHSEAVLERGIQWRAFILRGLGIISMFTLVTALYWSQ